MAKRSSSPSAASDHLVVGIEISGRRRQIEVKTMRRGRGRHVHYASLNQVPPELRGEALQLVRDAVINSGYSTLAEVDEALSSELVVPEEEEAAEDE
jgi:hypothetical protein